MGQGHRKMRSPAELEFKENTPVEFCQELLEQQGTGPAAN
jgi:hypothetical protein